MFNLFKRKVVKNYPLPKYELSAAEKKRRDEYNEEVIFKEVYIPNKRLEELIGMSMHDKNPHIKRKLTDAELDEVSDLIIYEMKAILNFCKIMRVKETVVFDKWSKEQVTYMNSMMNALEGKSNPAKMAPKPVADDTIYAIPEMRKMFQDAIEVTDIEVASEEKSEREASMETKEDKIERINRTLNMRLFMGTVITSLGINMIRMHVNFHGASVPMYDLH